MPVRDFASGGVVRTAVGAANPVEQFTMLALVNFVVGTEWMIARQNALHEGGANWESMGREGELLHLYPGDLSTTKPPNGVWLLCGCSKPPGTSKATYMYYRYDTEQLVAVESSAAFKAAYSGTPVEIQLGRWNNTEQFNGKYAAAMMHGAPLTPAEFKALAEMSSIQKWLTISPLALWTFNQSSVAEPVKDLTGNGANQTELIGTAIANEEPPIPYEDPPSRSVSVVRAEPDSGRLAFYVRRVDGTEKRIAGDEPEAEDIGRNFGFGTSIPGGYGNSNLALTRDPRILYGDFDLFDEFIARGPGGESAFEGYDIEIPNTGSEEVGLVATGWASSLKDNPTLQEIYVDKDLTRWGPAGAARKITMIGSNFTPYDPQVIVDPTTGEPAIELGWVGQWVAPWKPRGEAWLDCGPSGRAAKVIFSWKLVGAGGAAPWNLFIVSQPTDNSGSEEISADLRDTIGDSGSAVFTPTAKNRFVRFRFEYEGTPAGADGQPFKCLIRNVTVVGNHSVPLTASNGVLASDVVADIIRRAAPYLAYTVGPEGSIQASTFSIPHLIYPEPVAPEDAILQASKYDVPDWGVYNDRLFFWRSPEAGRLWVARQGDSGTTLQDVGKQADDVYNGVLVQFTDPSGKTFMVGPPGTPGCDFTDASLKDYSETNPLNERGRTRLGKLTVSAVTTLSGAVQLGARWLQEELAVSDRGSAVVTGFAQDSAGIIEPVWKVRAGDRIRFDDADGRERRIIETNYSHEERTNSLTLDSTPHRLDALMERMQVVLTAVGAGS